MQWLHAAQISVSRSQKLSQYANQPAPCHFTAVKNVFRYLAATKDEGLTYWRKTPNESLPDGPEPTPVTPSHEWTVNLDGSVHISPLHDLSIATGLPTLHIDNLLQVWYT